VPWPACKHFQGLKFRSARWQTLNWIKGRSNFNFRSSQVYMHSHRIHNPCLAPKCCQSCWQTHGYLCCTSHATQMCCPVPPKEKVENRRTSENPSFNGVWTKFPTEPPDVRGLAGTMPLLFSTICPTGDYFVHLLTLCPPGPHSYLISGTSSTFRLSC